MMQLFGKKNSGSGHKLNSNAVDGPQHYGGKNNPYEVIKVIEAWRLNFHLGNAVKYLARAGKKTEDPIEDLEKAIWYIKRQIKLLKGEQ